MEEETQLILRYIPHYRGGVNLSIQNSGKFLDEQEPSSLETHVPFALQQNKVQWHKQVACMLKSSLIVVTLRLQFALP
jgi:hypothetical protein